MRRSKEFQPAGITGSAGAQGSSRILPRSMFGIRRGRRARGRSAASATIFERQHCLSDEALLLIAVFRQSML